MNSSQPPKVLHVVATLDPILGGVTAAVCGMTSAQHRAGIEVRVLSTAPAGHDDSKAEELRSLGIDVDLIGPASGPLARHPDLIPHLEERIDWADCVHVHAVWEEAQHQACRIAQRQGVPYCISPHGMLTTWALRQRSLKKLIYRLWRLNGNLRSAQAIHYTTPGEELAVSPLKLKTPSLIEYLGIDLEEFQRLPAVGSFRQRFPQIGDRRITLFLSRLHPIKGPELLIDAFADVATPQDVLVLAGPELSEAYLDRLKTIVRQKELQDQIFFTGMLYGTQRIEAFVDADVFVLPSEHENFGIVVAESLSSGTPVIVSEEVNLSDFVDKHQLGLVVQRNPASIAVALKQLLQDEQQRLAIASRTRDATFAELEWQVIGRRWIDHYHGLISPPSGAS